MPLEVQFGKYHCEACGCDYFVNDGTWRPCTPTLCHSCLVKALQSGSKLSDLSPVEVPGDDTSFKVGDLLGLWYDGKRVYMTKNGSILGDGFPWPSNGNPIYEGWITPAP